MPTSKEHVSSRVCSTILLVALAASCSTAVVRGELVVFTSDTTLGDGNTQYEGYDITVRGCTLTVNGAHSFHSLVVERNAANQPGVVNHTAGFTNGTVHGFFLTVAGSVSVQGSDGSLVGSRIDVTGRGFAAASGPGAGTDNGWNTGSGAGHGGKGGNTHYGASGGSDYGSITSPTDFGSGGGTGQGGAGGGVLHLIVGGALTVDGQLIANGSDGASLGGGGSGGSVNLHVGTLAGSGEISADGGSAPDSYRGGGAGGRIAIYFTVRTFTGVETALGRSGYVYGGAGTIYTKAAAEARGEVRLDNGGNTGAATPLDSLSANLRIANAAWVYMQAATMVVDGDFRVAAGGKFTHQTGQPPVDLFVTGNATIDVDGSLTVDGKGHAAASGPGAGTDNGWNTGSGAGHGGNGGGSHYGAAGGGAYGSISEPSDLGSGGGTGQGGAGGGALHLTVGGVLTVNGQLTANGDAGSGGGGGGSGGSISLAVTTLTGSGTITANGGAAPDGYRGGGGGGRIAIYYVSDTFTGVMSAYGLSGYVYGGAGTIYRKSAADLGQVLIDNDGHAGARTPSFASDQFDVVTVTGSARLDLSVADILTAATLTVGPGSAVYLNRAATFGDVYVQSTATIQPDSGQTGFHLATTGSVSVDGGAAITANGKGHPAANGPGAGSDNGWNTGSGAGHGGQGGSSHYGAVGGAAYGSMTEPTELGSGGGTGQGGAGGGVLRLSVGGVLTVHGQISADGDAGVGIGGGGSGGSVHLTAGTLAGGGSISSNGGAAPDNYRGGGGGGRIAIYSDADLFTGTQSAFGSSGCVWGGAGTIYHKAATDPFGELLIDNATHVGARTPSFAADTFDEVTVANGGHLDLSAAEALGAAELLIAGGGVLSLQRGASFGDVHVASGGVIQHDAGQTGFEITAVGDVTVDAGGKISASGRGYPANTGPGAGTDNGWNTGSGAGHGGKGGNTYYGAQGGAAYGSTPAPAELGSGGGTSQGGAGGGALRMTVGGSLMVNGQVTASGDSGTGTGGGGSGGSVYLIVGTLAGTGVIRADGGSAPDSYRGGGAGGRIAIYTCEWEMFPSQITVAGGSGYQAGQPGTILFGSPYVDIAQPPVDTIAFAGEPTSLLVVASTPVGELTYQWRRNGVELVDGGRFSGVNTAILAINPVLCEDAGEFDVWMSDDCGGAVTELVRLTVPPTGDMNCSGQVDFDDINPFVDALSDQAFYEQQYPQCRWLLADCNHDGTVDFVDINPFVEQFGVQCP